jgi:hypothetical protein
VGTNKLSAKTAQVNKALAGRLTVFMVQGFTVHGFTVQALALQSLTLPGAVCGELCH